MNKKNLWTFLIQCWTDLIQPFKSQGTWAWAQCYHRGSACTDCADVALLSLEHRPSKSVSANKLVCRRTDSLSVGWTPTMVLLAEMQEASLPHKGHAYPSTCDRKSLNIHVFPQLFGLSLSLYLRSTKELMAHAIHAKKKKKFFW